jgi:cation diffusion facilitator family transporter
MVLDGRKNKAAALSLTYNVVLTVLKVVAAVMTGSVSLLSEAVHSATDVVASFLAFLSIRVASVPPDEEHPYGHGKVESLAGLGESVLLLMIVVYILFEAVMRIVNGSSVKNLDLGLAVMAFSSVTSLAVGMYVRKVGEESNSLALRSNGQHLLVDFWTSVGVLLALAVTRLTGWERADAVSAIGFAAYIAWGAYKMSHEAIDQLIDRKMPADEVAKIEQILDEAEGCLSWHRLRTRHSGHVHYIDVHIVVPNTWSVVQAHDLADRVEKRIQKELAPAVAVVHVDPYDDAKSGEEPKSGI